ncbi:hypothetical protein [Streptomyces fulvoviolaceus]|uniref:hypothetical protein n=1 Tax=Streptomyces fulvoviolaceus TaxID=285535 RepID=UPI0004C6F18E|nr:hypothetical protein [Streptomyces fulvoviolaceus]
MNATLVFVHGRSQQFKDPDEIKRNWLAGLASGLVKADLETGSVVDGTAVAFPFYANLLYGITKDLARDPLELESMTDNLDDAAPLHPYMPQDVGVLERQLLHDMRVSAEASGMVPIEGPATVVAGRIELESVRERVLAWGVTRHVLAALSRHTRVDQEIISAYLRDVAVYLTKARGSVLDVVKAAIPPDGGPIVLVSHSLGTVVACDLLADENLCRRTKLWVTAGSPLGLEAVCKNLETPGPRNIDVDWLTTYDVSDIVALGHPLQKRDWGGVENVQVDNGDEPHSIERYLGHPEVAQRIGAALAGA